MRLTTAELAVGDLLADGWIVTAITRYPGTGEARVTLTAPAWRRPVRRGWFRRPVPQTITGHATRGVTWDVAQGLRAVWA